MAAFNYCERLENIAEVIAHPLLDERERLGRIRMLTYPNKNKLPESSYSLKEIENQITEHTGITIDQMNRKTRKIEIVIARQMAHFKARHKTSYSLEFIGRYFGGKDHATVLYSNKTIQNYLDVDKVFRREHESFLLS